MIIIEESPKGLRVSRGSLVVEIEAAAIASALGPLIAELACGVPWQAPAPRPAQPSDFAAFALAWDACAAISGNPDA